MATITKPHTFVDDTDAEAAQVNDDFDELYTWVNEQGIHRDGTLAFTAHPTGPNSDPSSDNQYTRRKYVDQRYGICRVTAGSSPNNPSLEPNPIGSFIVPYTFPWGTTHATPAVDRLTLNTKGIWEVHGSMRWETNTNGKRKAGLALNGAAAGNLVIGHGFDADNSEGVGASVAVSWTDLYNAGDFFQLIIAQNSGVTLTYQARLWARLITPVP